MTAILSGIDTGLQLFGLCGPEEGSTSVLERNSNDPLRQTLPVHQKRQHVHVTHPYGKALPSHVDIFPFPYPH
jgi:hypothetical protein